MTPEERLTVLRDQLLGQRVTDRQLAGNSLSLWIEHVPGDGGRRGWTLWLEPSWHVVGPDRVLAGSMQAQDEEEDSGWKAVCDAADGLVGRTIDRLEVEAITGDIIVGLSGGVTARTFASDPRETLHWRIKDKVSRASLEGSPNGMRWLDPPNVR